MCFISCARVCFLGMHGRAVVLDWRPPSSTVGMPLGVLSQGPSPSDPGEHRHCNGTRCGVVPIDGAALAMLVCTALPDASCAALSGGPGAWAPCCGCSA